MSIRYLTRAGAAVFLAAALTALAAGPVGAAPRSGALGASAQRQGPGPTPPVDVRAPSPGQQPSGAEPVTRAQIAAGLQPAAASSVVHCRSVTKKYRSLAARLSTHITRALSGRSSLVGLAVLDRRTGITCRLHRHWHFTSASVVKATILAALLRKLQDEGRFLSASEAALARAMITQSDNNAASALWADVGRSHLQHFLNLAKMRETVLGPGGYWGLSQITAHDELTLLELLTAKNTVLDNASRGYELGLMAEVIPSQRWGVPAGVHGGVIVHVKNGWLPLPKYGWHINSIGSFSGGHHRDYMIVILTSNNPTMAYGVDTIQGAAEVINRHLA